MGRSLRRGFAALALLALAGCTTPTAAGVEIPTYSPRREALAYFPANAPVVAIVSTDPQDPGLRRLAASGALAPLRRVAERRHVYYDQLRGLLGNDAVVGLPHAGGPPLAVLTTHDGTGLDTFAQARVIKGRATRAGHYRGTDLYAERGWAFGVRDRVLLVGATVNELLEALDTRVSDHAFDAAQMTAVLPTTPPPAAFLHGYVDLRTITARGTAALRAIPLVKALDAAGFALGASPVGLRGTLTADTSAELTAIDLPALTRVPWARPGAPAGLPTLAVADLSRLAVAAERALRAALPVSALRLDALRERLRAAGVALTPELLAGPAEIVKAPSGPWLRAQPRRPAAIAAALARAARNLRGPRLRLARAGRLYVARDGRRVLLRLGLVDGALVAGRAPAPRLIALAHRPLTPQRGAVVLRLPRLARWYRRPVVLTLGGAPRHLRVDVVSGFPPRP
jgi:hypothetical protein